MLAVLGQAQMDRPQKGCRCSSLCSRSTRHSRHMQCCTVCEGSNAHLLSRVLTCACFPVSAGKCYLYIKTIERAHTPKNMWQRIKLKRNYAQVRLRSYRHTCTHVRGAIGTHEVRSYGAP